MNGSKRFFTHTGGTTVTVGDARIYVEIHGRADAPAMVLLHGGLGTLEDFEDVAGALGEWRLIAIDSRGHGMSTLGSQGWTYELVQHDVEAVLAHLDIERCSVLGFSDGGIAALRIAAAQNVQIDKLVVVGASWHKKNLAATQPILEKVTPDSWRKKFPEMVETYERLNPEPDFDTLVPQVVKGWLDESDSGHPNESVDRIECPVLIGRGDDDHLTALGDAVELKSRLKNAHFLGIPFADHVAYEGTGRTIFLDALEQFLRNEK